MWERITQLWTPVTARIAAGLLMILLAMVVYRILRRGLLMSARRGRLSPGVAALLVPVLRWTLSVIVVLALLQHFGVLESAWAAMTAMLALVAIGFVAVWSVLSNALCTILLLVFKPFRMGDRVELPATKIEGEAVDINFAYTTLRAENGDLIQIPNNTFFQQIIRKTPGSQRGELSDQLDRRTSDEELARPSVSGPAGRPA